MPAGINYGAVDNLEYATIRSLAAATQQGNSVDRRLSTLWESAPLIAGIAYVIHVYIVEFCQND